MIIRFLSIAQQEIDGAVVWYQQQAPHLAAQFLDEVNKSLKRITRYPFSCMEIEAGIRRCVLNRFPYGVIYGIDGDRIVIIAVAHLHRQPRYWHKRIKRSFQA